MFHQFLREALEICARAGDAASECIVRTALCNRIIDSGDARDALSIGQDGHAAALRLLSVAGSGRRHPSCWGLDPISVASQLEASIRRAKSLVQVLNSTRRIIDYILILPQSLFTWQPTPCL